MTGGGGVSRVKLFNPISFVSGGYMVMATDINYSLDRRFKVNWLM